jgi:hypothetical protein
MNLIPFEITFYVVWTSLTVLLFRSVQNRQDDAL